MYAIKVEFDTDSSMKSGMKIFPYRDLMQAAGWFNYLSMAFHYTKPVPVKGGGTVNILNVWKYEVDANTDEAVIEAVKSGNATLIDKAFELDTALNGDWP